jgi:hypothetical protein
MKLVYFRPLSGKSPIRERSMTVLVEESSARSSGRFADHFNRVTAGCYLQV